MKDRIVFVDYVRVIACFLVMLVHSRGTGGVGDSLHSRTYFCVLCPHHQTHQPHPGQQMADRMTENKVNMKKIDKNLPLLIFRCVALGLGLAVLTLLKMDKMFIEDAVWMLALAVTCLAACSLGEHSKEHQREEKFVDHVPNCRNTNNNSMQFLQLAINMNVRGSN